MSGSGWLYAVTAAALLVGVLDALTPEGRVKQVGRWTGGLFLFVALLKPLMGVGYESLLQEAEAWQNAAAEAVEMGTAIGDQAKLDIITEELTTYIESEAGALGITCQVAVECVQGEDGLFLPDTVTVTGDLSPEEQAQLRQALTQALSLGEEQIQFTEGGEAVVLPNAP
jgi:hypothetical protein